MGGTEGWNGKDGVPDEDLDIGKDAFRIELTRTLYQLMIDEGVSEGALAKKMGKSKAAVAKLLSGDHNMTVDTMTEMAHHLNHCPTIEFRRLRGRKNG